MQKVYKKARKAFFPGFLRALRATHVDELSKLVRPHSGQIKTNFGPGYHPGLIGVHLISLAQLSPWCDNIDYQPGEIKHTYHLEAPR